MNSQNSLQAAIAASANVDRIERHGLSVHQIDDLDHVCQLLRRMGADDYDTEHGGPYVTRWLDPLNSALSPVNSFWVFLFDEDGNVIGKIGNRLDDLGRETLDTWASRGVASVHPCRDLPPPDRFPDDMRRISGKVYWPGDLYIVPDWEGLGLAPLLVHLNYILALMKWPEMDWCCNYVRARHVRQYSWTEKGWAKCGGVKSFSAAPDNPDRDHFFCYADRDQFGRIIEGEEAVLRQLYAADRQHNLDDQDPSRGTSKTPTQSAPNAVRRIA